MGDEAAPAFEGPAALLAASLRSSAATSVCGTKHVRANLLSRLLDDRRIAL